MAKKRASGKLRGTDAGGQPYDLSNTEDYRKALQAKTYFANTRAERRVASRNLQDFRANAQSPVRTNLKITTSLPDKSQTVERSRASIAMGPVKGDKLSGRTTDAGTRSILDGMKNFMKSGAQGAFKGRLGGGGGGRPGTRL
jgi:hypothetical protein